MKSDVTSKNKISKKREEMSRLDEVIKELCPNGVEYKELKDICVIKKGVQLNKEKLLEEAEYPVINGGILPSGYWNDYNVKENTITISQGGASAGYVQYISTKFWAGAHCYYLELKDKNINYRYIYHFIKMKQDKLTSSQVGAGIPSIEKKILENLLIPVPPLEVQDEIVRILDDYTKSVEELKEKLNKELIARKKQYSWYRDYLLKFENKVEIVTLGDISEYSKDKIDIKELSSENYIGIENMLQDAKGVIKSSCLLTEGRCTKFFEGDILIGNIRPYLKKIWLSDRVGGANTDVLVIKKSIESIDNKYLFFVLSSEKFFSYVMRSVKAGKMPRGNKEMIMKYQFPLPPLEVQKRIVEVLDNFEKICNDLNTGLPAEIEARQKQYEFYRNYLLTFEEKSRQAILACELASLRSKQQAQNLIKILQYVYGYVEVKLGDISGFKYGYTDTAKETGNARFIRITDINENGKLKPYDEKYIDINENNKEYLLEKDDILMARTGATYGKTVKFSEDYSAIYASFLIKILLEKELILPSYYWHFTQSSFYWKQANFLVTGGGQPQFNANVLSKVLIPLPPLEEQQRIVDILDRFDKLCNDISEGLPAEIEARQKQYEYYREKLLSFKKL